MGAGAEEGLEVRHWAIEVTIMGPRAEEGFVGKQWPADLNKTKGRRELFVKRGTMEVMGRGAFPSRDMAPNLHKVSYK